MYNKISKAKSVKKSQAIKDKMDFLKKFKPKYIKRENIDKKIIRNFKRYLTDLSKKNITIEKLTPFTPFWERFATENLLPPMIYKDDITGEIANFKSFNTNYMTWLFSKNQAKHLYIDFISKKGNLILTIINEIFDDIKNENYKQDENEISKIKEYIFNLADIYYCEDNEHNQQCTSLNNDDRDNISQVIDNKSEIVKCDLKYNFIVNNNNIEIERLDEEGLDTNLNGIFGLYK